MRDDEYERRMYADFAPAAHGLGPPEKRLTIAIDYDDTYTADPGLWWTWARMAKLRGHCIVMVTGRSGVGEMAAEVRRHIGDLFPIVFAGGRWKTDAAFAEGYRVDIWIDDDPAHVGPQAPLIGMGKPK